MLPDLLSRKNPSGGSHGSKEEVVVPVSFERLVGFLDHLEARLREASLDLLTIRVVVDPPVSWSTPSP